MEDRLEEAIHVLRSHAVGQAPGIPGAHAEIHGLLGALSTSSGSMGGLPQAYSNPGLPLSNRHPTMVSVDTYVWSKQIDNMKLHPRHHVCTELGDLDSSFNVTLFIIFFHKRGQWGQDADRGWGAVTFEGG